MARCYGYINVIQRQMDCGGDGEDHARPVQVIGNDNVMAFVTALIAILVYFNQFGLEDLCGC